MRNGSEWDFRLRTARIHMKKRIATTEGLLEEDWGDEERMNTQAPIFITLWKDDFIDDTAFMRSVRLLLGVKLEVFFGLVPSFNLVPIMLYDRLSHLVIYMLEDFSSNEKAVLTARGTTFGTSFELTVHCCGLEFRVLNGYDHKSFDEERG
ncbi:hypothetical protein Tco_1055034 [Tanacetum coccineum]|uniref:Uncharacterized protein n=1 Tax=Tanacetum coccineum TaxID=301880 RepID=A0ABQ5H0I3_9ASTR